MKNKAVFVLRKITYEGLMSDEILGEDYHKLSDDRSIDKNGDFVEGTEGAVGRKYFQLIKENGWDVNEMHILIVSDKGEKVVPCSNKNKYFIMLNGATHDTIRNSYFDLVVN